jgi:hypothetical protein
VIDHCHPYRAGPHFYAVWPDSKLLASVHFDVPIIGNGLFKKLTAGQVHLRNSAGYGLIVPNIVYYKNLTLDAGTDWNI